MLIFFHEFAMHDVFLEESTFVIKNSKFDPELNQWFISMLKKS